MSKKTESEQLFEDLCSSLAIPWSRVAEAGDRRPDYEVHLLGHRMVVEVKQFDPNPEEKKAARQREAGKVVAVGTRPGDRIRKAIQSAATQLKALSDGAAPALLVVHNNVPLTRQHTDPYSVATAMQGLDVVPVDVPHDLSMQPQFQAARSGPGKKMTEQANTTISGIAVLELDPNGDPALHVYHNRLAKNSVDPEWLRAPRVTHWRLKGDGATSFDPWEKA